MSFTDASGQLINAGYTDYARAARKREGQTVQIVYDPSRPASIAPVGGDPRVFDVFFLALGSAVLVGMAVSGSSRACPASADSGDHDRRRTERPIGAAAPDPARNGATTQIRRLRVRADGDGRLRFSREYRGHCRRSGGAGRIARFYL